MPSFEPITEDHLLQVVESDNHIHQSLPEEGSRSSALIRSREVQRSSRDFEEWLSRNQHLFVQDDSHHSPQDCDDNTDSTLTTRRRESRCIPRRNSNPTTGSERASFRIGDDLVAHNAVSVERCDQQSMNDCFNSSMQSLPGAFPATGRPIGVGVVAPELSTADVSSSATAGVPGIYFVPEPALNPTSSMYQAAYRSSSPNARTATPSQNILDYDRMSSRRFQSWLEEQQQQPQQESEETTGTTRTTQPSNNEIDRMSSRRFQSWLEEQQQQESEDATGAARTTQPSNNGIEPSITEETIDDSLARGHISMPSPSQPNQRDTPAPAASLRRCSSTGSMEITELMDPSDFSSLPVELRPSPEDLFHDSMQTYGSNNNSATRYLHHKAYLNNGSNTTERSSEEFVRDSMRSNQPKSLHDSATKFFDVLTLGKMEDKVLDGMEVAERRLGKVTKAVFTKAPKKVVNGVGAGTKKVVSKFSRSFNRSKEKQKSIT